MDPFTWEHLSPPPPGPYVVSVQPSCVPAQQSAAPLHPPPHPRRCTPCDFCFMACGCIKPQSNNLVSSGAERVDISHGAAVRCPRAPPAAHFTLLTQLRSSTLSAITRHPSGAELCICMHCAPRSVFGLAPKCVRPREVQI